jgi:hypothetical protein
LDQPGGLEFLHRDGSFLIRYQVFKSAITLHVFYLIH